MTPTPIDADPPVLGRPNPIDADPPVLGRPNPNAPLVRPYYATLSEFERQVLDSRQADNMRDARMDYDPYD